MSNNQIYREIKLEDIFVSENGDVDLKKEDVHGIGIPIITSGKTDYGILGKTDRDAKIFPKHTITVDMFGYSAFRDHQYKMVTHARVFSLQRKDGKLLSKGAGLYLTSAMSYFEQMFDYNNMCSWRKIKDLTLHLPITKKSVPDWDALNSSLSLSLSSLPPDGGVDMSKIDTSTWQEFRLGDLFKIEGAEKRFNANSVTVYDKPVKGAHPYVVRTSQNNGVRGWIIADEKYLLPGNTLSFGQNTATVFYQEEDYFTGDKIKGMKPLGFEMTPQIACFMLANIRKAFSGFAWGQTSFNETVLNNMTILLPVKEEDVINYEYMEERIRELEEERIRELDAYLEVTGLSDDKLTDCEKMLIENEEPLYKEFRFSDIFEKIDTKKLPYKAGDLPTQPEDGFIIPCLTAGKENQGLARYSPKIKGIETLQNVISVSANGANTGVMFYQDAPFYVLQDAYAIRCKQQQLTENQSLYLIACMSKRIRGHFDWTNKAGWARIKNEQFQIPVKTNDAGNVIVDSGRKYHDDGYIPDFDFMDRYITAQKKLAVQSVNTWRKKEIETTEQIVKSDNDVSTI